MPKISNEVVLNEIFKPERRWELFRWNRGKIQNTFVTTLWLCDLFKESELRKVCYSDKYCSRIIVKCGRRDIAVLRITSRGRVSQSSQSGPEEPNDRQE